MWGVAFIYTDINIMAFHIIGHLSEIVLRDGFLKFFFNILK